LLNELGDQAGQHEVIAETLSTQVVHELSALVKQLKEDRRKVRTSIAQGEEENWIFVRWLRPEMGKPETN